MPVDPVRRAARAAVLVLSLILVAGAAQAQERERNQPGKFDFYVLALSWSPSYCASVAERAEERSDTRRGNDPQCGGRPFAFVVHGLWPQYERGFPSFCERPAPRISRAMVDGMLDLMPSPRLVYHEWDRHGTCSGLSASAYFDAVRKARAAVKVPEEYSKLDKPLTVSPAAVSAAFLKANPGLPANALSVACDKKRITDVRVCLSMDFAFRDCGSLARYACRRDELLMPAMRGS